MANNCDPATTPRHLGITEPSPWLVRFAPLIRSGGAVLDLACGGGRHSRHMLAHGYRTVAIDRSCGAVADLADNPDCRVIEADLEDGRQVFDAGGALAGRVFDGVVVINYLHRPLFAGLIDAIVPGGVLIYETFARGNEIFTRPRNPDHLLKSGELLRLAAGRLDVVAYEHGIIEKGPIPGVIQRICAVRPEGTERTGDAEPGPRPVHPG